MLSERLHLRDPDLAGELAHRGLILRPADEKHRLGVLEKVVDLGRRVARVERQEGRTRPQGAEVEEDRLGTLVDLHRHPITRLDAQFCQNAGCATAEVEQISVAELGAVGPLDEGLAKVWREGAAEGLEKVLVHAAHGR